MQPKHLLLTALLSFVFLYLHAQRPVTGPKKCGTTFNLQEILANPEKAKIYHENERRIKQQIQAMRTASTTAIGINTQITIPVVFHIVNPNPSIVTDEMIYKQLDVLNRDYSGFNSDSFNAPVFYPLRAHSKIKFELAKRSPRGCDTIGIVRVANFGLVTLNTDGTIKHAASGGSDAWESYNCKYLNIWIGTFTDGYVGKGTFPDSNIPQNEQGVVVDKKTLTFTYPGVYIYGRTLVHEVGHYLNLKHIWGDDENAANTCSGTDLVDDTPNQSVAVFGQPAIPFIPVYDVCSPAGTTDGINYQNYMDYGDDTALTMFTSGQIERIIAGLNVFANRSFLFDKKNKALVPQEENKLFTQCNTPAFTTNNFTCVGVGYKGVVWAGSSQSGLYNYYGGSWHQYGSYVNNLYQDIEADRDGGIWVAQSGYNGAQAQTGGVLYFPDSLFPATPNYYSALAGLPSRYPRSLFIDTARYNIGPGSTLNPLVWTANFATVTAGISANGGVGRGFLPDTPNFKAIRGGLEPADLYGGTASCYVVGGNSTEIWTATQNNYGRSQVLRYDAYTNDTLPAYDTTNVLNGLVPGLFVTRAIYFDKAGRKWISVNGSGLIVQDVDNSWKKINYPKIFPTSPFFNNNAISGDEDGNVYIGTTSGLIVYTGGMPINKDSAFTLYTTSQGLPSNNIKSIAIDTLRQKLILATDAGVMFWNPTCANGIAVDTETFSTTATGDWNNPAIWCNGVVPPANAKIIVRHPVTITTNTHCKSLQLVMPGSFTVAPGIDLSVGN